MRRPRTADALVVASFDELGAILQWLDQREGEDGSPTTVLIGGWAVYAINPYFGSYDIDLVTNARTRKSLMQYLRDDRGYARIADDQIPFRGVALPVRGVGTIKIDFATFDAMDPFENTDEELSYEVFRERAVVSDVEGVRIAMPDRSALLLSKLKAAWDRQTRLDEGRSFDPPWERGKVVKDRADILALVDPVAGAEELDIVFLGGQLERFPFLLEALSWVGHDVEGIARYARLDTDDATSSINTLVELVKR